MSDDEQPVDYSNESIPTFGMYIDGDWITSEDRATVEATNPATGEGIARFQRGTRSDAQRAIKAANQATPELESATEFERAELLHEIAECIEEEIDELTQWLTQEQGKPLSAAQKEVESSANRFRQAAEYIKRDEPPTLPSQDPNKQIHLVRKPHGVYGVITPWNYPLATAVSYLSAGIAAGNSIIWAPAPETTAISVKFVKAIDSVLPDGMFNLLSGEGPVVGDELVVSSDVDAIAFTGSPAVGEEIASKAKTKPTLLELGGNGPLIILDDADIASAVSSVMTGCFGNAGQICTSTEYILVHDSIHDEVVERLTDRIEAIQVGPPTDENTDMGPLNNEGVASKVDNHIADAVEKGANVKTGGQRMKDMPTRLYYEPTLLTDATSEMKVCSEETFGPVAPVSSFSDYNEAIQRVNDDEFGLSAGVFTSNIQAAHHFAERIESGLVNINDTSAHWESHTPVGGYTGTRSGTGRYGGRFTIDEMSQIKTISIDTANVQWLSGMEK